MNEFLPKDYVLPKESDFMTLRDGMNKFRILSAPTRGYQYFNTENKPVRSETKPINPVDLGNYEGKPNRINYFWAVKVYNFATNKVELLTITQITIIEAIIGYISNSDWGDPRDYNLTIKKEGQKMNTKYTVMPSPRNNEITEEMQKAINETDIDFEEWMRGGKNIFIKKEVAELEKQDAKDENDVISSGMPQANFPQEEEFSDEDKAQFGRTFGGEI